MFIEDYKKLGKSNFKFIYDENSYFWSIETTETTTGDRVSNLISFIIFAESTTHFIYIADSYFY